MATGFDAQNIINTAAAAKAVEAAESDFTAQYKSLLKNSYTVSTVLSPQHEALLKSIVKIPFITSKNKRAVTNDHPVMFACRELIRQDYDLNLGISALNTRTLVVGSSAREIFQYHKKDNFDFYLHGSEGKDNARSNLELINEILKITKDHIQGNASLKKKFSRQEQEKENLPIYNFYKSTEQVLEHFKNLKGQSDRYITDIDGRSYNTLLFEDSLYNFDETQLIDIFQQTNAQIAYGYMVLPLEFFFKDVVFNPLYHLREEKGYMKMGYKEGYCNGYVHKTDAWRLLADNLGIHTPNFNLLFEITSRIGPFVTFKIIRTESALREYRTVELFRHQRYVKILNIVETNSLRNKGVDKFSYFSVLNSEFYAAKHYFFVLKEASLTVENLGSFVRHRMTGASLVNRELLPEWELADEFFISFVLALHIEVIRSRDLCKDLIATYADNSWGSYLTHLKNFLHGIISDYFPVAKFIFNFLFPNNYDEKLVIYPKYLIEQSFSCPRAGKFMMKVPVTSDAGEGEDNCPFCKKMKPHLGKQKIICEYKEHKTNVTMNADQLAWLKNEMLKDLDDNAVSAEEKEEAIKHIPKNPFTYQVPIHYIFGPPGTGKTDFACTWADPVLTGCIGPYKKLLADYENFKVRSTGETKDFLYKTHQHKAFKIRGKKILIFDEWTAISYQHFAVQVFLNQPDMVILLGDHLQNIIDPQFGDYIGRHIDIPSLSRHTLVVNFRNGRDVVAMCNRSLGYCMEAFREDYQTIEYVHVEDLYKYNENAVRMFMSDKARQDYGEKTDACVPSHQGCTYQKDETDTKDVILFVTKFDRQPVSALRQLRVGITRHKRKLYIAYDDSNVAKNFLAMHRIENDVEEIDNFIPQLDLKVSDNNEIYQEDLENLLYNCKNLNKFKKKVEEKDTEVIGEDEIDFSDEEQHYVRTAAQELKYQAYRKLELLKSHEKIAPFYELAKNVYDLYKDPKFNSNIKSIIKFFRVCLELLAYYKGIKVAVNFTSNTAVWTFLLKQLIKGKIADYYSVLSDLFPKFSSLLSSAPTSGLLYDAWISNTLCNVFSLTLPAIFQYGLSLWRIVNIPYNFSIMHGISLFSHYLYYKISPFDYNKLEKFRTRSREDPNVHQLSFMDTNYRNGYCWLNAFHPSWHQILSLIFPPIIDSAMLMSLYSFAFLFKKHEVDICWEQGHLFKSINKKRAIDILKSFITLQPIERQENEMGTLILHPVYSNENVKNVLLREVKPRPERSAEFTVDTLKTCTRVDTVNTQFNEDSISNGTQTTLSVVEPRKHKIRKRTYRLVKYHKVGPPTVSVITAGRLESFLSSYTSYARENKNENGTIWTSFFSICGKRVIVMLDENYVRIVSHIKFGDDFQYYSDEDAVWAYEYDISFIFSIDSSFSLVRSVFYILYKFILYNYNIQGFRDLISNSLPFEY